MVPRTAHKNLQSGTVTVSFRVYNRPATPRRIFRFNRRLFLQGTLFFKTSCFEHANLYRTRCDVGSAFYIRAYDRCSLRLGTDFRVLRKFLAVCVDNFSRPLQVCRLLDTLCKTQGVFVICCLLRASLMLLLPTPPPPPRITPTSPPRSSPRASLESDRSF